MSRQRVLPSLRLTGVERVQAEIAALAAKAPQASARAMFKWAEVVMLDSISNYVPVRWGILRSSGKVHLPTIVGKTISVTLSYGNAAADYAIYVHEGHRTKSHYLSKPFLAHVNLIHPTIAREIQMVWRSG